MSNKTLLNEVQVRKFMKLARLEPLTNAFVNELDESHGNGKEELNHVDDGLGRRRDRAGKLEEEELEDMSMDAEEDISDADLDLDAEVEIEEPADEGRMISVDDFLGALESALESAMGEEVDIDSSDLDDDSEHDEHEEENAEHDLDHAADLEDDAEEDLGDLSEDKAYSAKKEKPGADKRKGAEKRGAEGTLAKTQGHGRVDYVNEDEDYTAKKEKPGADKRKGAEKRGAEGTLAKTKGHGRVDYVNEDEDNADLVESITKKVAKRIILEALSSK